MTQLTEYSCSEPSQKLHPTAALRHYCQPEPKPNPVGEHMALPGSRDNPDLVAARFRFNLGHRMGRRSSKRDMPPPGWSNWA